MKEKKIPNVSGTFQAADDEGSSSRAKDLNKLEKEHGLDEESLYYARQFMED